ncbi:hypothetical protein ACFZCP_38150, partial [Streptomyces sp. NPDC007971]|uniref:hypothetical protein n=1 Tax=Streptomyces sp. NPDC007971 TaxID=3364799 RepID=UPI0036E03FA0
MAVVAGSHETDRTHTARSAPQHKGASRPNARTTHHGPPRHHPTPTGDHPMATTRTARLRNLTLT